MATQGKVIGTVSGINGKVTATAPDGTTRILKNGDKIHENEKVAAQDGSNVHIDMDGSGFATIGAGDSITFDSAILAQATEAGKGHAAETDASMPSAAEIEALQARIAEGDDPTALMEAAAAGQRAGGGAQEGSSFVIVEQNAVRGEVTPGFATDTFGNPVASQDIQLAAMYTLDAGNDPDTQTPAPAPLFDERMVMYMDSKNLSGNAADINMVAKANTGNHVDEATPLVTEHDYGTAKVVNGQIQYELSDAGKAALGALSPGQHLVEYITYMGTDGKAHTIQVILTTDAPGSFDFDTLAHYDERGSYAIPGETHYGHAAKGKYNVTTSAGDDVFESKWVQDSDIRMGQGADKILVNGNVNNSKIGLGNNSDAVDNTDTAANYFGSTGSVFTSQVYGTAGNDRVIIGGKDDAQGNAQASQHNAALTMVYQSQLDVGQGDNKVDVFAHTGFGGVAAVHSSTIQSGDGTNTIRVDSKSGNGEARGMISSTLTLGDGDNTIHIFADGTKKSIALDNKSAIHTGRGENTITVTANSIDGNATGLAAGSEIRHEGKGVIHVEAATAAGVAAAMHTSVVTGNRATNTISIADGDITLKATSATGNAYAMMAEGGAYRVNQVTALNGTVSLVTAGTHAYGMSADTGGRNNVTAGALEMHLQGDEAAYGMYANGMYNTSNLSQNTVVADQVTIDFEGTEGNAYGMYADNAGTSYSDPYSNEILSKAVSILANHAGGDGYAMYADHGGKNWVHYEGSEDVIFHFEGDLYSANGGSNTISTDKGNDHITVIGDIIGESTGDANFYSNQISSGAGDDTITVAGQIKGVFIDGGEGWDILNMDGMGKDLSLGDMMHNNVIKGIEVLDLAGGEDNVLSIGDVITNGETSLGGLLAGLDQTNYTGEDLNGKNGLMINGDANDSVVLDNSWQSYGTGTVDHGGSSYHVYQNSNGDLLLIDQKVDVSPGF